MDSLAGNKPNQKVFCKAPVGNTRIARQSSHRSFSEKLEPRHLMASVPFAMDDPLCTTPVNTDLVVLIATRLVDNDLRSTALRWLPQLLRVHPTGQPSRSIPLGRLLIDQHRVTVGPIASMCMIRLTPFPDRPLFLIHRPVVIRCGCADRVDFHDRCCGYS